ncbi:Complexin-1 [Pteropus alecto]|uniref:Complexin-1 n=1 Tax=Pteropus alecto TaxID=9402 RepID=L5K5H8_PTEAL|nr:Complexin-1 [Pteropus alecto]
MQPRSCRPGATASSCAPGASPTPHRRLPRPLPSPLGHVSGQSCHHLPEAEPLLDTGPREPHTSRLPEHGDAHAHTPPQRDLTHVQLCFPYKLPVHAPPPPPPRHTRRPRFSLWAEKARTDGCAGSRPALSSVWAVPTRSGGCPNSLAFLFPGATKDMGKMLGGDEEKDPDAAKKEEERQEALRQEEEERKAKYAKMEAEREAMRQGIRDKDTEELRAEDTDNPHAPPQWPAGTPGHPDCALVTHTAPSLEAGYGIKKKEEREAEAQAAMEANSEGSLTRPKKAIPPGCGDEPEEEDESILDTVIKYLPGPLQDMFKK